VLFRRRSIVACGVSAVVVLTAAPSLAQIGIGGPGLRVDRPDRSIKDLRDQGLVKQRFDFSCGAAALATILRYGFGESVTERQILEGLFDLPSEDEKATRRRTGFSLLDLQRVAEARGYNAQGFRLDPEQLPMLGGPVIVFIEPRGYKHFAVLRGVRGDRVYLADPSRGNIRVSAHTFLKGWLQGGKGIIFVVEPKTGLPSTTMPLALRADGLRRPEVLTAREMLAVGSPLVRWPDLSRYR
jgi:predicted double-glycine peptidase